MDNDKPRSGPGRPPTIDNPVRTIRDAASSLIAGKGYDSTSLQDVANAVGVTKAGLYHYFPTKQALFESIVLNTLEELHEAAAAAIAAEPDHHSKLVGFMSAHATYFADHGDKYRASFFGRAGGDLTSYNAEELAARKAYTRLLEELLENGVRDGAFAIPDIPVFARGILGMLNWMSRWFRPDGPLTAPQIAQGYAKTILSGIST